MDEQKNVVTVKINGVEYKIASSADEEYVRHVAFYVDKKMRELMDSDHRLTTAFGAVMTAVNVADDYFRAQEDAQQLRAQLLSYAEETNKAASDAQAARAELSAEKERSQTLRIRIAKLETELEQLKKR